jgi:hypothetical protein
MSLLSLTAELSGVLPGLSPPLAETFLNRALAQIYGKRTWSFLETDGVLVCPAMVTTGTANITQYTASVTLNAAASAALLAQTVGGSVPGLLQWQIRFGTSPSLGFLYSIIDFDATNPAAIILTLDRVVQETTSTTSAYQAYRAYVTPPITDFLKWESLVDVANAIPITGNRLTHSSATFDARDPQRTSAGLAYYLGGWGGNRVSDPVTGATVPNATVAAGTPIYELWPHPTSGQTFYCRFRRKGESLINPTDTQMSGISDALLLARVFGWHAYPFAMANVGNFPTMKVANWPMLIASSRAEYKEELTDAKRNDDAQQLQSVWSRGHTLRGGYGSSLVPADANFVQAHLLWF